MGDKTGDPFIPQYEGSDSIPPTSRSLLWWYPKISSRGHWLQEVL